MKTEIYFLTTPANYIKILITNFTGATITDLPPGVLYRVKSTYKYVKEDQDELSFEVGDVINVIEYDDPDDQVRQFFLRINQSFLVLSSFF